MDYTLASPQEKVLNEKESRKKWLQFARQCGFEKDVLIIFAKYDKLLKNCTNDQERRDIGKLGAYELFSLFGRHGDLYVDGQLVWKDQDLPQNKVTLK